MTDVQALARAVIDEGNKCKHCRGGLVPIPCPDDRAGCGVLHVGPCPSCRGTGLAPSESTPFKLAQSVLSLAARVGELEEALREVTGAAKVQSCPFCDDKGRIEVFPPAALDEAWPVGSPVRYFKPCRACFGQLHIAKAILEHARAALAAPRETRKE